MSSGFCPRLLNQSNNALLTNTMSHVFVPCSLTILAWICFAEGFSVSSGIILLVNFTLVYPSFSFSTPELYKSFALLQSTLLPLLLEPWQPNGVYIGRVFKRVSAILIVLALVCVLGQSFSHTSCFQLEHMKAWEIFSQIVFSVLVFGKSFKFLD